MRQLIRELVRVDSVGCKWRQILWWSRHNNSFVARVKNDTDNMTLTLADKATSLSVYNDPVTAEWIYMCVFCPFLSSARSTTTTSADCLWPVSTTCRSSGPCKWHRRVFGTHYRPDGTESSHPCPVCTIDWSICTSSSLLSSSNLLFLPSPPHLFSALSPVITTHSPSLPPPLPPSSRLHSNNLQCDCHVAWLSEWLRQRPRLGLYTQCMAPPHLRGHNVAEVQKKEFACTGRFSRLFALSSVSWRTSARCFTVANPSCAFCFFLLSFAHAFQDEDEGKYSSSIAWLCLHCTYWNMYWSDFLHSALYRKRTRLNIQ